MEADVDLFLLGQKLGVALGPHVETDDDGVRGRGEEHVGLRDRTRAAVEDPELHLVRRKLGERLGDDLDRALHVGLEDDRKLLDRASRDLLVKVIEREPCRA